MFKHYIIMSSSYSNGKRIALDITNKEQLNTENIKQIINYIKEMCDKEIPLSTHYIETDSESWKSVEQYDPFFEDVECISNKEDFAALIRQDRTLVGLDIAKYIISKHLCTHLELEKLVYFCYADYLCQYSEKLFEDKVYAFTHGPVIESVYSKFKRTGRQFILDENMEVSSTIKEMPAKSRILFAKDGAKKIQSIDKTLEKYEKCTAGYLVDLTHRDGSPWSRVDSSKSYQTISDSLIKEYHYIETL